MEESDDIIEQRPALALGIIVVVGALAYAAISLVMRSTVDPVETGLFAVAFGAVYVAFARYSETVAGYLGSE